MKLQIVDNDSKQVLPILMPAISRSEDVKIAVAFVSQRGLSMIEPAINDALRASSKLEFLIGLDFHSTEPMAVRNLYDYSRNNTNFSLYCYASLAPSAIYHPKLYAMRKGEEVISVIGSSNLTEGGLKRNVEVNVVIEGNIRDEVISDIYGTYNILKFHQKRVAPDDEYIILYEKLSELGKEQHRRSACDKTLRSLIKTFSEKSESLRGPKPKRNDLFGWLELVYDSLPEGEFTNHEIYEHKEDFQRRYPENKNINAKIRQQLQVLRDLGLIKHRGRARWVKG